MSKFKVGDKVMIRKDLEPDMEKDILPMMAEKGRGLEGVVFGVDDGEFCRVDFGQKHILINNMSWHESALELLERGKPDKVSIFREITGRMADVYEAKNHDYGDSFGEGFAEFGLVSSVIRLGDKYRRLKSLVKEDAKVKDESIRDTLLDLANYAVMTLVELERDNAK